MFPLKEMVQLQSTLDDAQIDLKQKVEELDSVTRELEELIRTKSETDKNENHLLEKVHGQFSSEVMCGLLEKSSFSLQ